MSAVSWLRVRVLVRFLGYAILACPALAGATSVPLVGPMPREVEAARAAGLFALPVPSAPPGGGPARLRPEAATRLTQGAWRVPVILVSFSDQPPAYPPAGFQVLLFDTLGANPDGSLSEYYKDVSRGQLSVTGDVVGWYTLPHPRSYYAGASYGLSRLGFPQNDAGLACDALAAVDPDVDFSVYDRDGDGEVDAVFFVHVGLGAEAASGDRTQLWSITSSLSGGAWDGVSAYVTQDLRAGSTAQHMKVTRFCILPERSPVHLGAMTEIGTYCHEFGHILGWPDLYDTSTLGGGTNFGPGNWCLMASGSFGGDSRSPERPVRPCAWALFDAGWITVENLTQSGWATFPPVQDADGRAYRLWWEGGASPEYLLLEDRVRRGFDADLPGEGLLVYRVEEDVIASRRASNSVNSGSIPGLRVEEADGIYHLLLGITRGDDGDPFPGSTGNTRLADETRPSTRSYAGRYTNVSLSSIEKAGDPVRAWVQVDPSGWGPAEATTLDLRLRVYDTRPLARRSQRLFLLGGNESDSSRVYALRRAYGLSWGPVERVSSYPGAAEPSWTDPIGGPLAATWSDRRYGNPGISYRLWDPDRGPERRATFSPGFANHPGGVWLTDGRLALLWLDTRDGKSQIYFKAFYEGQEEGAAETRVTDPFSTREVLDFAVTRAAGGTVFLAYSGREPGVDEVYTQSFRADSGWSAPARLSEYDGYPSGNAALLGLPDGNVRVVWRDSSPTRTTVQTALYDPSISSFVPGLRALFASPFSLPLLQLGPGQTENTATVIARASEPPFDRVLVGHEHPDKMWDYGLGWISRGIDAGSAAAGLDVDPDGLLTALWISLGSGTTTVWTRQRAPAIVVPVAVPPAGPPRGAPVVIRTIPNPACGRVRFRWGAAAEAAALVLYSPAGRRVARLPAADGEAQWLGRDDQGRPLGAGIYLYRLEDADGRPLAPAGKLVWLR